MTLPDLFFSVRNKSVRYRLRSDEFLLARGTFQQKAWQRGAKRRLTELNTP
jgi:hypothetical protein